MIETPTSRIPHFSRQQRLNDQETYRFSSPQVRQHVSKDTSQILLNKLINDNNQLENKLKNLRIQYKKFQLTTQPQSHYSSPQLVQKKIDLKNQLTVLNAKSQSLDKDIIIQKAKLEDITKTNKKIIEKEEQFASLTANYQDLQKQEQSLMKKKQEKLQERIEQIKNKTKAHVDHIIQEKIILEKDIKIFQSLNLSIQTENINELVNSTDKTFSPEISMKLIKDLNEAKKKLYLLENKCINFQNFVGLRDPLKYQKIMSQNA